MFISRPVKCCMIYLIGTLFESVLLRSFSFQARSPLSANFRAARGGLRIAAIGRNTVTFTHRTNLTFVDNRTATSLILIQVRYANT